ncbi:MAG: MnhB domain-containing protein [Desulfurococcaceae archaeon]
MSRRIVVLLVILAVALILPLVITVLVEVNVPRSLRDLGKYYVKNTINDTASPEAVAAVVWDYRGLDTIYETVVLYLALVGGLAIFRAATAKPLTRTVGLTELTKTSTRIIVVLIATIAACIALHGHLTPGGGFQGGSTLATASMLIVPVFTLNAFISRNVTSAKLIAVRGLALASIGIVALLPVLKGFELVTNQRFYPSHVFGIPLSGSIMLYNLFEAIAVAAGFTAIALYLSIPEEYVSKKGDHG